MESIEGSLKRLGALVGSEIGASSWESFDQASLNAFGALTGESLPIHCDPAQVENTGYEGTIVQASLLLARLGSWAQEVGCWIPAAGIPLNYGYDRVRVLAPVPVDHPVRGRFVLTAIERRADDLVLLRLQVLIEMRNRERPAIVAEWIIGFFLAEFRGRQEQDR